MKSAEYKKEMKRYRCKRCRLVKWVINEPGYFGDGLCEDCDYKALQNNEDFEDWE